MMKSIIGTLLLMSIVASTAAADSPAIPATWEVNGSVSGTPFVVDCTFEPKDAGFGGVCIDVSAGDSKTKAGTRHPLTQGDIAGTQLSWTYQSSFLFTHFDVAFSGTPEGDRMAGSVTAAGRKGSFTAVRK